MSGENQPTGRHSPQGIRPTFSLRMVLVGKTGAGKSSSGNTILGRKAFKAHKSLSSITKECWKEAEIIADKEVVLVDTPGLFDTTLSEKDLKKSISKCINMTAPGPHAIILVIQLGPFTHEQRMSVEQIRTLFGEEADRYTMILFTHGDQLTETIEEQLAEAGEAVKNLIGWFGGRYHVFDNTRMDKREQVLEFIDKVENMLKENGGECYTNDMFQDVEQKVKRKEEELKKLYEAKVQEKERQYEEEKRKLEETITKLTEAADEKVKDVEELKLLVRRKDKELNEYKRFYNRKHWSARLEAEHEDHEEHENVILEISKKLKQLFF